MTLNGTVMKVVLNLLALWLEVLIIGGAFYRMASAVKRNIREKDWLSLKVNGVLLVVVIVIGSFILLRDRFF